MASAGTPVAPARRRPSRWLWLLALGLGASVLTLADARRLGAAAVEAQANTARLVGELVLTDLSLFTEARYTRHLSQSDLHSAFQDHPGALEHFPSGSLVAPTWHPPPRDEPLVRETTLPR